MSDSSIPKIKKEMFVYSTESNLNEIVHFHNFVQKQFENHSRSSINNNIEIAVLDNYKKYLAINSFLMVYSYFEEYLCLLWRGYQQDVTLGRINSIKHYKPMLRNIGVNLGGSNWGFLMEAVAIRNCLLHANGRVSFIKEETNRDKIRKIVRKYPGGLSIELLDSLTMNSDFVSKFVQQIRKFLDTVSQWLDNQAD